MSKISSLTELANFVARSNPDPAHDIKGRQNFWQAYRRVAANGLKRRQPARVSELLAMVMAISARTRRMVAPRTHIELDVFNPAGKRAVYLIMGKSD